MKISLLTAFFRRSTRPSATKIEGNGPLLRTVHCHTHGQQAEAFVCKHIFEGLLRRDRVGFFWSAEDPNHRCPDAWCVECDRRVSMTGGEWEGEALEHLQPKIMCCECYDVAKTFHMGGDPWS